MDVEENFEQLKSGQNPVEQGKIEKSFERGNHFTVVSYKVTPLNPKYGVISPSSHQRSQAIPRTSEGERKLKTSKPTLQSLFTREPSD